MNKERNVTKVGAIIVFKGPIIARNLEKLENQNYLDVVVDGDLIIDRDFEFLGNLYVTGKILSGCHDITIYGNLSVEGEAYIKNMTGDGDFYVGQLLYAKAIKTKGDLTVYGNIIIDETIKVSGTLICNEKIISRNLCVGENLYCRQYMDIKHSNIDVAGDMTCHSAVEANNIHVLGKMTVMDGIRATIIKIGY